MNVAPQGWMPGLRGALATGAASKKAPTEAKCALKHWTRHSPAVTATGADDALLTVLRWEGSPSAATRGARSKPRMAGTDRKVIWANGIRRAAAVPAMLPSTVRGHPCARPRNDANLPLGRRVSMCPTRRESRAVPVRRGVPPHLGAGCPTPPACARRRSARARKRSSCRTPPSPPRSARSRPRARRRSPRSPPARRRRGHPRRIRR